MDSAPRTRLESGPNQGQPGDTMGSDERATKSSTTFRMRCAVAIDIGAPPEAVWALLTHADDMPRWNSTVTRVGGRIAAGSKLAVEVPAAPGRTFRPRVAAFDAPRRMVWSDGFAPMFQGTRTYALTPLPAAGTRFEMDEVFSGLMLPLIKSSLPDFVPIFERYAQDLKREAEHGASRTQPEARA